MKSVKSFNLYQSLPDCHPFEYGSWAEGVRRAGMILIFFLLSTFHSFSQQAYIDSLKTALIFAKADSNRVKTLTRLSQAYAWSIPDTGIGYASEALALSKKLKWGFGEYWANAAMGQCLTTLGNYPLALDYLFKALSYFEKQTSKQGIGGVYGALSVAYRDMGEYRQSLSYLWKALTHVGAGVNYFLLGNLASVYAKSNQPDSAIYYAARALKIQPNWSGVLVVLGDSYIKLNQPDSANYYFDLGIAGAIVNRNEIDLVDLYHGKAQVYQSKNQLDSAILYARKAMLETYGKYYPRGVLNAITTLSDLYERKHQPDSTLKYLRAAIDLRDSLFNREKTMAIQNLAFKEQEKLKDIEASQLKFKNQLRLNALTGSLFTVVVISFILYRNNKQKQKSFNLLHKQKQQIDIQKTELEHTLSDLKSTQAQLIQSEKMAALGALTAGIAHEIQNPLNFVNNFAEVNKELIDEIQEERRKESGVRDEHAEGEILNAVLQNMEKINFHGKRADGIVKSMLQHSRMMDPNRKNKKEPTDINALVDEYLRLAYHGLRAKDNSLSAGQAGFNATLRTDLDESIGMVEVMGQDISRALLNLITNALQAVQEQKKKKQDQGENYTPEVSVMTKKSPSGIEIHIRDNGPGIPENLLDKIFQPFFTTKPAGHGTGLGLSLAYDIVKSFGGELKAASKEGEGSEFIVRLPV